MNSSLTRSKTKNLLILSGLVLIFAQVLAGEITAQKKGITKKPVRKTSVAKAVKMAKTAKSNPAFSDKSLLPKITQIDAFALGNLLKRDGENAKPLLINFWATWCDPCREEFPELVKIDADYKGKIDFITVSLDDLAEIDRDVPRFLAQMKAEMPALLLKTENEEAAIASVSKSWQGGLPFTILFDGKGATIFTRQGKIKPVILRGEIDKLVK